MNAANRDISRKRVPNGDHELECDARRLHHCTDSEREGQTKRRGLNTSGTNCRPTGRDGFSTSLTQASGLQWVRVIMFSLSMHVFTFLGTWGRGRFFFIFKFASFSTCVLL